MATPEDVAEAQMKVDVQLVDLLDRSDEYLLGMYRALQTVSNAMVHVNEDRELLGEKFSDAEVRGALLLAGPFALAGRTVYSILTERMERAQ